MTSKSSIFLPQPGIQKDGTRFSSRSWIDGQWVRFQRGLPRKIGGYKQIVSGLTNIPRKVFIVPNSPNFNVYIADYQSLRFFQMDQFGNALGGFTDRTPIDFFSSLNNNWKIDSMYSTITNSSTLISHASQSLASVDNTTETPIYYGDATGVDRLLPTGIAVSGGFAILHPFLLFFGNDGSVGWSEPSNPTVVMDSARICGSKIVAGYATRGGNTSPAGLLWSLDSVIRVTQVSITQDIDFRFDTLTDESSILSSNSVVEYDGFYYWVGLDKFYVYNGTIQELPNNTNLNYFFDNINFQQRQKVWGTKVPRFGEIWWHFPTGNNTECDAAVIYNVRENCWYSTDSSRGAGYFTQIFTKPVWTDNDGAGPYNVWSHETGVNQTNLDGVQIAIDSHIQSPIFSNCGVNLEGQVTGVNKNVYIYTFEPDFVQSGEMSIAVNSQAYANDTVTTSAAETFDSTVEKIDLHVQGRELSFTIECNGIDSNFEMGQVLVTQEPGDDRP